MDACIIDDICEEDATEPNMLLSQGWPNGPQAQEGIDAC